MKTGTTILLSTFLLFVSCSGIFPSDRKFHDAWELMDSRPDSVLAMMEQIPYKALFTPRMKGDHALLLSLARYRCYVPASEDSTARVAVDYYRFHKPEKQRMLAWFCLGLAQKDMGNDAAAIVNLRTSEDLASQLGEHHYLGLITREIAELYERNDDFFHAGEALIRSIDAFEQAGDPPLYANCSRLMLAVDYMGQLENEKADSLFQYLMEVFSEEPLYLSEVFRICARMERRKQGCSPDNMLEFFRKARDLSGDHFTTNDYGNAAYAFSLFGEKDSVAYYLDLARSHQKTDVDTAQYLYSLYLINKHEAKRDLPDAYLEQTLDIQNERVLKKMRQSLSFSQAEHYRQESLFQEGRITKLRSLFLYGTTVIVLLILLFAERIRRQALLRKKDLETIAGVESQLMELQKSNTNIAQTVFELVSGKLETVKMLSEQYDALDSIRQDNADDIIRLRSADMILDEYAKALDLLRKNDSYLDGLEQALNLYKDGILYKLRSRYGKGMDDLDYKLLILFFSGLPVKTISYLTGMDSGTVYTRRTRYKNRFEKLDSPEGQFFIDNLGYKE